MTSDRDEAVRRMAAESLAADDPTGWFDRVYAAGPQVNPWDLHDPQRLLTVWASAHAVRGHGRRAIVVGCGMGRDAEYVASLGFETVAFDISETAVRLARARYPESAVQYVAADLLDPPHEWQAAFDLVAESFNGPRDEADAPKDGPPWSLTRAEIDAFATGGLRPAHIESIQNPEDRIDRRWRAEFHRPV